MSGGYGYEVRSYNNTVAQPVAEKWMKLNYTESESDHVAKQQPHIERIIEKKVVHSPPTVFEYVNVTPVKYGVEGNRWRTGLSTPVVLDVDRPMKVEEFVTKIQTEVTPQPHLLKPGYLVNTNRATSPKFVTTENNPWVRNSAEPSSPRTANWRKISNSSYGSKLSPETSYVKELEKERLGGNLYQYDETPKDFATEHYKYLPTEPRPSSEFKRPGNWATTTTTKVTTLTKPTNDIKEAVNYLTGSIQQSSITNGSLFPQQQYYNGLGHQKMEHYEDVINSREAQRRYGDFNGALMGGESYVGTIDSREALRKYGGAVV